MRTWTNPVVIFEKVLCVYTCDLTTARVTRGQPYAKAGSMNLLPIESLLFLYRLPKQRTLCAEYWI